jgi:hypothetical protein
VQLPNPTKVSQELSHCRINYDPSVASRIPCNAYQVADEYCRKMLDNIIGKVEEVGRLAPDAEQGQYLWSYLIHHNT